MKAFVLRDIWDIFATRILIGLAIVLVATALVIGISIRNKEPDALKGVASGTTTAQEEEPQTTTALRAEEPEDKQDEQDSDPQSDPEPQEPDAPADLPADESIVTTAPPEAVVQNGTTAKKTTTTRRNSANTQQPSGGNSPSVSPTPVTPSWTPDPDPTPTPVQTQAPASGNPSHPTTHVATNAPVRQTTAPVAHPVTVVTTPAPVTYVNNGHGVTADLRFISREDNAITVQIIITNYNSSAISAASAALRLSSGAYIRSQANVSNASYSLNGTSLLLNCNDVVPARGTYTIVATIHSTVENPTASLLAVS